MTELSRLFRWRQCIRESDLEPLSRLVAHTLATYMDKNGRAFPAQQTIAKACGLKERAVRMHLVKLREAGYLEWKYRKTATGRVSEYVATVPLADWIEGLGEDK